MKKFVLLVTIFSIVTICFGQYNYEVLSVNKKVGISNTFQYSDVRNIHIHNDANNILKHTIHLKDGSIVECPISEIDSVSFNREGYNITPIVFYISHEFVELSYLNSQNFICFKNQGDSHIYAQGLIENQIVSLYFDSMSRISSYIDPDIMLSFDYSKLDSSGIVYISIQDFNKNTTKTDSISVSDTLLENRHIALANRFSTNVLRNIINYALDKLENGLSALQALKLLYETDEMDHNQKIDYILNDEYKLIPRGWIDRILENFEKNDSLNLPPSYFIDVKTGNATNITAIGAKLPIDGYIHGIANEGELNFEYGVIYSTSPDFDIYSGTIIASTWNHSESISSINITLPKSFTVSNLKPDTKFYYRAFWRNLDCMSMCVYGEIKSFKTEKPDYLVKVVLSEHKDLDEITDWDYHYVIEESELEFHLNELSPYDDRDYWIDLNPNVTYHTFDNPSNFVRFGKWEVKTCNMQFNSFEIKGTQSTIDGNDNYIVHIEIKYKFNDPQYGEKNALFAMECKICRDCDGNLSWTQLWGSMGDIKTIYVDGIPIIEKER